MTAPFKLASVTQLQTELAQRRARLLELKAAREAEHNRLVAAREQHARLGAEIHDLEGTIGQKNQAIFVLLAELDRLLQIEGRIKERALELAHRPETSLRESPARGTPARAHPRSPFATEVSLGGDTNFYVGFSQDISEGGLFVATHDVRPIGERFLIAFKLQEGAKPIRCMVEVAWIREYHEGLRYTAGDVPGMGLKFIALEPDAARAINGFQQEREPLFFPEVDGLA